jgi:hypothetical protein
MLLIDPSERGLDINQLGWREKNGRRPLCQFRERGGRLIAVRPDARIQHLYKWLWRDPGCLPR